MYPVPITGRHPGEARTAHFEWASHYQVAAAAYDCAQKKTKQKDKKQTKQMTAPLFIVPTHTRQLTARWLAIFSKDVLRTGYHMNPRLLKVALM